MLHPLAAGCHGDVWSQLGCDCFPIVLKAECSQRAAECACRHGGQQGDQHNPQANVLMLTACSLDVVLLEVPTVSLLCFYSLSLCLGGVQEQRLEEWLVDPSGSSSTLSTSAFPSPSLPIIVPFFFFCM